MVVGCVTIGMIDVHCTSSTAIRELLVIRSCVIASTYQYLLWGQILQRSDPTPHQSYMYIHQAYSREKLAFLHTESALSYLVSVTQGSRFFSSLLEVKFVMRNSWKVIMDKQLGSQRK